MKQLRNVTLASNLSANTSTANTSTANTSGANTSEPAEAFKVEYENNDVVVRLINPTLIDLLRRFLQADALYDRSPKILGHELFLVLPELKKAIGRQSENDAEKIEKHVIIHDDSDAEEDYEDDYEEDYDEYYDSYNKIVNKDLESLVDLIEAEYESKISSIKEMISNNVISFKYLFYLFSKGQHIRAVWDDSIVGARVTKISYHRSIGYHYLNINAEMINSNGSNFYFEAKSFNVNEWEGVRSIEKLPVVPLPKESPIRDDLKERGRKFAKYANGRHYLQYTGNMFCGVWFGIMNYKSEGRVMVDAVTYFKMNPGYANQVPAAYQNTRLHYPTIQDNNNCKKSVKEEELFMCTYSLYGFSFVSKKWGQLYVELLDEIKFDDDAFDQLVMDPIKKELISSLVTTKHTGMDIISGKGGGCVFLLHGSPGVGKTLTAEAISEYLHRPLYAVSVGELGTSVVELENKLSQILEVASIWNAVILIDEADIFLERRSEHDIQRNALVSVFLRLLEYHQGILFLTTNRVKCFDPAFQSRISIALKYNDLDSDTRNQVWHTFLNRVEGKDKSQVNIESLKDRTLNGREIKTAVRLAKALTTKNDPNALITTQQLETILDISKSFSEELNYRDLNENSTVDSLKMQIDELKMQLKSLKKEE